MFNDRVSLNLIETQLNFMSNLATSLWDILKDARLTLIPFVFSLWIIKEFLKFIILNYSLWSKFSWNNIIVVKTLSASYW